RAGGFFTIHGMGSKQVKAENLQQESEMVRQIFSDFESRSNIVGLFDLLLKIAKRNPKLWAEINEKNND
ncbi:MAG: hypothetical protein HYZ69_00515, partial [Candidatus Colwellbacteria bacterium]|nr:hypothetical protein [Candidatus Colwellbacteria bacterium]